MQDAATDDSQSDGLRRMDAGFAAISICMSCVWLNLVASEVVSLLQTFGMVFNAPTVCTCAAHAIALLPCFA